jgi:putative OPT family oligopeptide transporter
MSAQQDNQPQLSARAIILAVVLAMVLGAANTYLGLFAGLTIASAIPAAVVSMGVLRLLGGGGILENNIVATGASAGNSIPSGVIFTLPALVILGYWSDFKYSWVLAIAGLGGLLGVLFSVPLRRSLIIEQKLAFPEGKAAAEVLKAGANPARGLKTLAVAALGGGIVKLCSGSGLRLIPDAGVAAGFYGKYLAFISVNLSPALLGVGYIVGLNVGIVMVMGGIISWSIAIPIYNAYFLAGDPEVSAAVAATTTAADAAFVIWSRQIRYLGVGAMLLGGIWTLISLRKSIISGIRSGLAVARAGTKTAVTHTERDLPMKAVLIGIMLFTLPLLFLYQLIVGSFAVSVPMAIIMVIAGFLFCSVAAYMAGLVGSSNSPVSGITVATIIFAALVLTLLMGPKAELGPVAAIMIGAVVCCAASVAADNLQDLKSGQLVGATPWRQQVMLGVGALSAALIMSPVLNLLAKAYGIGIRSAEHPNPLTAPQATLMAAVSQGMFGGHLPWAMVGIGAAIGAVIIVVDEIFKARSNIRVFVLAAAVGIYLPLEYTMPIFVGGVINYIVDRAHPGVDKEALHRPGTLFAAGMITGESLMGIFMAVPIVMAGRADVLALPESARFGQWLGMIVLVAIALWLYRTASRYKLES